MEKEISKAIKLASQLTYSNKEIESIIKKITEETCMENYKEIYNEFWKHIVEDENGELIKEQVKKELADFSTIITDVSMVYNEFTSFSKVNTKAEFIIGEINEKMIDKQIAFDDLSDMLENGELTKENLKEYFGI